MKKIFVILFLSLSLFLSGCTAEYNIEINEDKVSENTVLTIDKSRLTEPLYNTLINDNSVYLDEDEYYAIEESEDESNSIFSYKYIHDINKFADSRIINWCYNDREIINNENTLTISTKGSFNCANRESRSYVENARINIKTDLEVLENNADEVNDNTYTWIINENNYRDKPIYIQIQKNNINIDNNNLVILVSVVIIFASIITLSILIIKSKMKKANKF